MLTKSPKNKIGMKITVTETQLQLAEKLGISREQYVNELVKQYKHQIKMQQLWQWYRKKK